MYHPTPLNSSNTKKTNSISNNNDISGNNTSNSTRSIKINRNNVNYLQQ